MSDRGAIPVKLAIAIAGGVVVLALAAVFVIPRLFDGSEEDVNDQGQASEVELSEEYVNREAGYAFRYPEDWRLEKTETATELINPKKDASISIGRGPAGDVVEASAALVDELRSSHKRVRTNTHDVQRIGGQRSLIVAGSAVNSKGVPLRFLTIVIPAKNRNYGIDVFATADSDPREVVPAVEDILGSFRILSPA